MLKLGEKIISDIYLGDKKIAKVFLGDKLVYQAGKPIFLDYVEFDGNSRIDTGVIPSNNMEFETGVMFSAVQSTNLSIIASRDGEKRYQPIGATQNKWSASIGGVYDSNGSPISANIRYDLRAVVSNGDSISLYSGNTLVSSATSSGGIPTKSLYLFARNFSTVDSYVTGRLYYCKIWNDGTLIQDLRPCIDHKGVVCMYDMVTKKYFYNQGTGTLTAGNKINFVDYIIFDGNSYIDTGITQQTCTVECGIKFANADTRQLMGFHSSNAGYWGCRNTSGRYEASGGLLSTAVSALDYNDVVIDYNCDDVTAPFVRVTVKDITASVAGTAIFTTKKYTIGALLNNSAVDLYHMTGQVYYNKFYIGGELIQDLKPCVVAGVAGFYDMVTGKVFTNAGTGTLKASGRFVESIIFDGESYIDTGKAKQGTWKIGAKCTEPTNLRNLLGVGGYGGQYCASTASGKWGLGPNHTINVLSSKYTDLIIDFIFTDTDTTAILSADGLSITRSTENKSGVYTFKLGVNYTDTIKPFIGEVGYVAYYDVDSNLNLDLRPYVDNNGVACFKDMVTGELFYNKGTGTLGYTE